jgi:hypothetical protein
MHVSNASSDDDANTIAKATTNAKRVEGVGRIVERIISMSNSLYPCIAVRQVLPMGGVCEGIAEVDDPQTN